ncbi:MAG: Fe-S cluster assembly protein SufD [Methylococcales bacterium]
MDIADNTMDHFHQQFGIASDQLSGHNLPWLQEKRQQALDAYTALGLPGRKDEEWRYTQIREIQQHSFKPVSTPGLVDAQQILDHQLSDAITLVFVDGFYQANLSKLDSIPDEVVISNLATAMQQHPKLVEASLDATNPNSHGFSCLNTAFFNDGVFIHVPAEVIVENPIQFIFFGTTPDAMITSRNLIIADHHSSCRIIEVWAGTEHQRFCNTITEIIASNSAEVTIDKIQDEGQHTSHISSTFSQLAEHAVVTHRNFNFGGRFVRNDIHTGLGQSAACHQFGLTLVNQSQHVDNHLRIDHNKPDTVSRIQYKNIADDKSRAVFQGRIVVHKDAQKTDSNMSNKNLLLSDDAIIYTKPQLEIDADDVQCAHGVTVGELEQSALFYLRSRGIDEVTARNILTFGFAKELLETIESTELKTMVLNKLLERFPQAAIRADWL